jgi:hypothetical protein
VTDVRAGELRSTGESGTRSRRIAVWGSAALVVAVLAFTLVVTPYHGDHAVYALIGRDVLDGRVLYRDIWDIKQPGLFLWYGLVTGLLGFTQVATRLADVLAVAVSALLVGRFLAPRVGAAELRRWAPLIAAAVLFLAAGPRDHGQLELLCLVPALGAVLLVAGRPGVPASTWRIVAAGLCLGLIGVVKLVLAAVPAAAVVVYLLYSRPRGRGMSAVLVAGAAAAVPVAVMVAWLVGIGAWADALRTWLVDPLELAATPGAKSLEGLAYGATRYLVLMAPVVVLAASQAASAWRRRDALDIALVTWVLADIAVIGVQFWWTYQWYFLCGPLLVLGLRRLDGMLGSLARAPRRKQGAVAVAGVLLSVPMLAHGALPVAGLALDGGGLTSASRAAFGERVAAHGTIRGELAAAGVRPGDRLYVIGDPLYNYLADLPLPLPTNGWGFEFFTPRHWADVADEGRADPPTWVFVERSAAPIVEHRAPGLRALLAESYEIVRESERGVWYRVTIASPP